MGFKVPKNMPPMERELQYLLADLCVKWGFCIPVDDINRISKMDYYYAEDFAMDVIEAEGMDIQTNTRWIKLISERFIERFGSEEIDISTFTDRVRGKKEDWST